MKKVRSKKTSVSHLLFLGLVAVALYLLVSGSSKSADVYVVDVPRRRRWHRRHRRPHRAPWGPRIPGIPITPSQPLIQPAHLVVPDVGPPAIGGGTDDKGCKKSAGYSWNDAKKSCTFMGR